MLIAFFVNAMKDEYLNFTTTVLALRRHVAAMPSATSRRAISCSVPTMSAAYMRASYPRQDTLALIAEILQGRAGGR